MQQFRQGSTLLENNPKNGRPVANITDTTIQDVHTLIEEKRLVDALYRSVSHIIHKEL